MERTKDGGAGDLSLRDRLTGFVPEVLFDSHAHLFRKSDFKDASLPRLVAEGPDEVGLGVWRSRVGGLLPSSTGVGSVRAGTDAVGTEGRPTLSGGLFFPYPTASVDIEAANRFLFGELSGAADCRGLALVAPRSDRPALEELFGRKEMAGFKPYHLFAEIDSTFDARPLEFVPEWALEAANEHRYVVMLHIVRDRALADPVNQDELVAMCRRYPAARFVLAHAARGFNYRHTVEGIARLRGIENVWFDTSGICESEPILAILDEFGPSKLLWGSDFPVSGIRGRAVTLGDGFFWIDEQSSDLSRISSATLPSLVGLESLAALERASARFGLDGRDREAIFGTNARILLGIDEAPRGRAGAAYEEARALIPGGVHLLSKSPTRYAPGAWPAHFAEARGCETRDLDGRHYYDMSTNGIGSCLLGFRDPDVTRAVVRRINLGSMSSLNPPEEVDLARLLVEMHPWANEVRLGRTGGEIGAIAVRIARATTDRSLVAVSGYHGWHDWYLAANLGDDDALRGHLFPGLGPLGVPRELRGTTLPFAFNDVEAFDRIIDTKGRELAAVVMEPCRHHDPAPGFLAHVAKRSRQVGALLIFDEITIGFRLARAGAHARFGVEPDLAMYAKALGNGHPIGAVVGSRRAMAGAHESFISSTYWTEGVGPAAALATLQKLSSVDVPAHVARVGSQVQSLWRDAAARTGVPVTVEDGYPCLAHFSFDHPLARNLSSLYSRLMLDEGFLAATIFYPTLAHTDEVVDRYGEAIERVFTRIAGVIDRDEIASAAPPIEEGFRRLVT